MARATLGFCFTIAAVLAADLVTAQTLQSGKAPAQAAPNMAGQQINYIQRREAETWRASDLIGKDVYGASNQNIGEVADVLISRNGQVVGLAIEVGGFLGIGESKVAVPLDAVQFLGGSAGVTTALPTTPNPTGTRGAAGSATTGTGSPQDPTSNISTMRANAGSAAVPGDGLPERIVLNVTKQQLEAAPKFEANR